MKNYSTFEGPGSMSTTSDQLSSMAKPTFSAGNEEYIALGSRVTFNNDTINIENPEPDGEVVSGETVSRGKWKSQKQYYANCVSYAVGLGNMWRFPYLMQKNGGGAFLLPYLCMMASLGVPLFLIELAIGQMMAVGSAAVWNRVHPYAGGIGIAACLVSYFVAAYYNIIITWCEYYLVVTFASIIRFEQLPWTNCPTVNETIVVECAMQSPSSYYWNHDALQTARDINDWGGPNYPMMALFIITWLLIALHLRRGIESSGIFIYVTSSVPYIVTTIFLVHAYTLPGFWLGIRYMIEPDIGVLKTFTVWLEAATQIFYSIGLGFGGLTAYGSYNAYKNNVVKDVWILNFFNLFTSLFTAVTVFGTLGGVAYKKMPVCIETDMRLLSSLYPQVYPTYDVVRSAFTDDEYLTFTVNKFDGQFPDMIEHSEMCSYRKIISESAEGTGLAFVVFTEAIVDCPFPKIYSLLFFTMLSLLGCGSIFGMVEGITTSIHDRFGMLSKRRISDIVCGTLCIIGLIFTTKTGQFWVNLFDSFSGSFTLMFVSIMMVLMIRFAYGVDNFCKDIQAMVGFRLGHYWRISWGYTTPAIMLIIFTVSFYEMLQNHSVYYFGYDPDIGKSVKLEFPSWALYFGVGLLVIANFPIVFVWFIRRFRVLLPGCMSCMETDIPTGSRVLNTTQSTTQMIRSETSFIEAGASAELVPFSEQKPNSSG